MTHQSFEMAVEFILNMYYLKYGEKRKQIFKITFRGEKCVLGVQCFLSNILKQEG